MFFSICLTSGLWPLPLGFNLACLCRLTSCSATASAATDSNTACVSPLGFWSNSYPSPLSSPSEPHPKSAPSAAAAAAAAAADL